MSDIYSLLSGETLLKEAWHLAHKEARTSDFILDSLRHGDFGFHLHEYIGSISRRIKNESYHPNPLRRIDVPKSNYAVRPGSSVYFEDLIVLYAVALLIAPKLDDILPEFVSSWRVKPEGKRNKELFKKEKNRLLEKYPFWKPKTIRDYADIFKPWYDEWISHNEEMAALYVEGYNFMVVSDVVAYFENIELALLRELLINTLGGEYQKIVNFLIWMLSYWAWPATNWLNAPRGIPQGNGVSSFIGNVYLLPLDQAFENRSAEGVKYLRYMDDITIFAKDYYAARNALLDMTAQLRELRLNVQGAKTEILKGKEIENHLSEKNMDRLNPVIDSIVASKNLSENDRRQYSQVLRNFRKGLPTTIKDHKQSRFYRRMVYAHSLLQDPSMINRVFGQIRRNSDYRVIHSAYKYFKGLTRNTKSIHEGILDLLSDREISLFDFQKAWLLTILRYTRDDSSRSLRVCKLELENDTVNLHSNAGNLYVKEQAAIFYGTRNLDKRQKKYVLKQFEKAIQPSLKRAWIHGISQISSPEELNSMATKFLLDMEPEIHRLGAMVYDLLSDHDKSIKHTNELFRNFESQLVRSSAIVDRIWEIDVLSKNRHEDVKKNLLNYIVENSPKVRFLFLRNRLLRIQRRLEAEIRRNQNAE